MSEGATIMTMPNFLIIGAARCGTTALANMLAQHPEVFFSTPKEPHFMALAGSRPSFAGPGDEGMINQVAITKPAAYARLFAKAGNARRVGEGSVSTLYYHQRSIKNIQRHAPDAKLIVILRNPIQRAFSSFLYMTARGFEPCADFRQALDDEPRRVAGNWHHIWHYTQMGLYHDQLVRFLEAFGAARVHVVLFDDLDARPNEVVESLYRFLDIEPSFRPATELQVNRSGIPKSRLAQTALRTIQRHPWLRQTIKTVVPFGWRERIRNANLSHPELSNEVADRLATVFQQDVNKLAGLLQRDLSVWGSEPGDFLAKQPDSTAEVR